MRLIRGIVVWLAITSRVADEIVDGVCHDLREWIKDDADGVTAGNLRALTIIEMYRQAKIVGLGKMAPARTPMEQPQEAA